MNGHPGYWEAFSEKECVYSAKADFAKGTEEASIHLKIGAAEASAAVPKGEKSVPFDTVNISPGDVRVECWLERDGKKEGVHFLTLSLK